MWYWQCCWNSVSFLHISNQVELLVSLSINSFVSGTEISSQVDTGYFSMMMILHRALVAAAETLTLAMKHLHGQLSCTPFPRFFQGFPLTKFCCKSAISPKGGMLFQLLLVLGGGGFVLNKIYKRGGQTFRYLCQKGCLSQ